jgi:3-hydroxyacyl-CoA dehydrogenase
MIEVQAADGICVLRLCAPPLNTLSFELLDRLGDAVRQANQDPEIRAIVITGGPDGFSAGADVGLFRDIGSAADAIGVSRVFQQAFQVLEDSPQPIAAAMAGTVVGGALELAMACHLRVAATGSRFRMPEVNLGINPGAGGTQRLPRLVGLQAALQMLLTAETVSADRARELGLIDAVCPAEQLIACAARLLGGNGSPLKTTERTDRIGDAQLRAAAFQAAEQLVARGRPEIIAPQKILEAVRTGVEDSAAAGMLAEQQAFAQCMDTSAARNKIRLFFATSATSKLPELADIGAAPIQRAAVIGMGTMGTGIAHALIQAGLPVVILDQDQAFLERGVGRIQRSLDKRVEQGKLAADQAAQTMRLLHPTSDWNDIAAADVVIESVYENPDVKRPVLQRAEQLCGEGAVLATNTSTISLDCLADGLRRPERLIGLHFFNPAQRMPLVEVIRRPDTPPEILAAAVRLAKRLRKTPVLVASREGFLVNRIFVPYLQEAFALLEEGAAPEAIDRAAIQFGFPMGPLVLIDMAGIDILVQAQGVLEQAFPHHGPLSAVATRLVAAGHLGQKTGAGVYRYASGATAPLPSPTTAQTIADVQAGNGRAARQVDSSEIAQRLVLRMVNEAFYVLQEGVARCETDVDVAMVLGTGFPDFRGGVIQYARDMGLPRVVSQLESFGETYGERFSPGNLLREMKGAT